MRAELGRHRALSRRRPDAPGPGFLRVTNPAGIRARPASLVHVFPRVPGSVVAQAWPAATLPLLLPAGKPGRAGVMPLQGAYLC
jgi:hypothetical protein